MRKSGKFFIGLVAVLFSGLCISMASPATAADTSELIEESTDLDEPEVDVDTDAEPMVIRPTSKL